MKGKERKDRKWKGREGKESKWVRVHASEKRNNKRIKCFQTQHSHADRHSPVPAPSLFLLALPPLPNSLLCRFLTLPYFS